jgi:hypothetical protein
MRKNFATIRLLVIAAAAVILSTPTGTTAPSSPPFPYELLIPGHYSTGELPKDVEGTWFALTWSPRGSSFQPVSIRLQQAKNPRATGDLTLPGAIVRSDHPDSVIFLLRGKALVTHRSASTWSLGEFRMSAGDSLRVGPGGRWRLSASEDSIRFDEGGEFRYVNVTVSDSESGLTQQLGGTVIQWMGDVNADGGLDFLLLGEMETGERIWRLLLSGGQANKLFREVAYFHLPGC